MSLIRKKLSVIYTILLILVPKTCHFCSGIDLTHPEFEGRAKLGVDVVDNPPRQDDPNGHGTHVAGEKCTVIMYIYCQYKMVRR